MKNTSLTVSVIAIALAIYAVISLTQIKSMAHSHEKPVADAEHTHAVGQITDLPQFLEIKTETVSLYPTSDDGADHHVDDIYLYQADGSPFDPGNSLCVLSHIEGTLNGIGEWAAIQPATDPTTGQETWRFNLKGPTVRAKATCILWE